LGGVGGLGVRFVPILRAAIVKSTRFRTRSDKVPYAFLPPASAGRYGACLSSLRPETRDFSFRWPGMVLHLFLFRSRQPLFRAFTTCGCFFWAGAVPSRNIGIYFVGCPLRGAFDAPQQTPAPLDEFLFFLFAEAAFFWADGFFCAVCAAMVWSRAGGA